MTAPSLAEQIEITYGLSKAKDHPTTSDIAFHALDVIAVLGVSPLFVDLARADVALASDNGRN